MHYSFPLVFVLWHIDVNTFSGNILGRGHRRPPGSSTDSDAEKKAKGKKSKKSKNNKTVISEDTAG